MKNSIGDSPFLDLLGLKKKENLTEEQRLGKAFLQIAKEHKEKMEKFNQ